MQKFFSLWAAALLFFSVCTAGGATTDGAESVSRQVSATLNDISRDLPQITRSASRAAHRYAGGRIHIGVAGAPVFVSEMTDRSGGLRHMEGWQNFDTPNWKGIVLFALRDDSLPDEAKLITSLHTRGDLVIVFGRRETLTQAKSAGFVWDDAIETHAAAHGGLLSDGRGGWFVPTDEIGDIAAGWVWCGEFIAACTRLGRMPTVWESVYVPGGTERDAALSAVIFDPHTPIAVPPGRIGTDYLRLLRADLGQVHAREMENIHKAAAEAATARAAGHLDFLAVNGHSLWNELAAPHFPSLFQPLQPASPNVAQPGAGDFLLALGYTRLFDEPEYHNFAVPARAAGAKIAWSLTDVNKDQIAAIKPGEIYIDQRWGYGDAVVTMPGYDVKILPDSGVIQQVILLMITAQMLELAKEAPHK